MSKRLQVLVPDEDMSVIRRLARRGQMALVSGQLALSTPSGAIE